MRHLVLINLFFVSVAATCNKPAATKTTSTANGGACYKARLAIKGICTNYVIQVLEGDTSKLALEKSWKDETDGKVYTNVFALDSRCSFPDIAEGGAFYFTLAGKEDPDCNVCMAYRPVPAAKNSIVVSKTPCP